MTSIEHKPIVVGEPNWLPLEMALSSPGCEEFMYMGRAGEIELFKHRSTRRYLNISSDGERFFRSVGGSYIEISRADAIEHVFS